MALEAAGMIPVIHSFQRRFRGYTLLFMAQSKPELENIWRERLREARLKYEAASDAFRATWGEHFESRLTADPTLAIEQARDLETAALCEYVRVLRIYTDLTVHGKLPPEDDGGTGNQ
jgi:hypothetical protein